MNPPVGDPQHASDLVVELAITKLGGEMAKSFAEVNGKLDLLTADGLRHGAEIASLETRVSALEKRVWLASGAAMLVGIVAPWIIQLLNAG